MALQKVKKSLIWDKGLDTKTNPKITEGYLQLENCQVNNVTLEKSKGLNKITTIPPVKPNNNIPYTVNVFSTFGQLEIAANNKIYEYDPLSTEVFERGNFSFVTADLTSITVNNAETLYYSEYGNYGVTVYLKGQDPNNPLLNLYYMKVQNIKDVLVIQDFNIVLSGLNETPVGLIATQYGVFVYTRSGANGQINEYLYTYTRTIPNITSNAIIANTLQATSTVGLTYQSFKYISVEYDGGNIWIFSISTSGDALVTIRNTAGFTVTVISNAVLVIPNNDRVMSLGDFRKGNLNSFFWNKSPIHILQPGPIDITSNSTIWAQFNETICIFNTQTQSLIYKFTLPNYPARTYPFENRFYFSQSICYLQDTNSLYVLQEDLTEYEFSGVNQVFPYTIQYIMDSNTNTWTINNSNFIQPKNFKFNANEWGRGFVIGALWPTENNIYFCVQTLPFSFSDEVGHANPNPPPANFPLPVLRQPYARHSNIYIIDYNYNLSDFILHYNAYYIVRSTGLAPPQLFFNQTPNRVIEAKENRITGKVPYTFFENTSVDIQTNTYNVGIQTVNKLVSFDRGLTGYFGITNMYMCTQENAEYSQFLDFPTITLIPSSTTTLNKFYTYAATFEYINSNGELIRTTPSVFQSVSIDISTDTVDIYYTYPCALESKENMIINIWRTTLNTQTFYLLTSVEYIPGIAPAFYRDNGESDTTLINAGTLAYFNGGVLGEIPFDPFTTFTAHQNTIFTVNRKDQNIVQYSLPYQPTVAMSTAFGFQFTVEALGGPIVELASIDEKLIILKENYLFVTAGQGADALGNNSTLIPPELITSPVGCSQKASVVRIPEIPGAKSPGGIMFKSSKGIYLLDRSLSVTYIGAPVERFNNLTIISTALAQTENKCRFTTLEGTIITYDYYYDTWDTEIGIDFISSTVHEGNFIGIDINKEVFQIFDGYYKNGLPYNMTIGTPWVKLGGLQGYQRVYKLLVLGDFKDTSTISVGIMYDFVEQIEDWLYFSKNTDNSYGVDKWGAINPFGGMEKSNLEIQFNLPRQKCQSIRFIIKDEFSNLLTDTGDSFTLTELAIIAGVKSESVKLPVNRRV